MGSLAVKLRILAKFYLDYHNSFVFQAVFEQNDSTKITLNKRMTHENLFSRFVFPLRIFIAYNQIEFFSYSSRYKE